jgi:hypothetical protein
VILNAKESRIEKDQVAQEVNPKIKIKSKVYRELKQLESSYNPDAIRIVNNIDQERDSILDQANIALFSGATQFESKILNKHGITMISKIEKNRGWQLRKRLMIWIARSLGNISERRYSKSKKPVKCKCIIKIKETKFLEPDLLNSDTLKFRVSISTKVSPL